MTDKNRTALTAQSGELVESGAPQNDSQRLMALIERAASDPAYDPDKLGKLLDVRRQWEADEARKAFNEAFSQFQADCPAIPKTGKAKVKMNSGGEYKYDFPKFEIMQEIAKPVLNANGLHAKFGEFSVEAMGNQTWVKIHCIVAHRLGHSISEAVAVPIPQNVPVNDAQKAGIALSYAKRYAYAAALGLVITGIDHDASMPAGYGSTGQHAQPPTLISDKQAAQINEWLESLDGDKAKFCGFLHVPSVAEIPASRYDEAIQMLREKERGEGRFKGKAND